MKTACSKPCCTTVRPPKRPAARRPETRRRRPVAPTNLFFKPGRLTQEELLANLGDGLFLTEVTGLHAGANPVSGDFSLLSRGYEIKGGKIVRAVEEFTVAGNFYQLLKDITDVGGDLLFETSPIGSPSVLVKSLSVAGA